MLGAPAIHQSAKMNEDFFLLILVFNFFYFYSQFYFNRNNNFMALLSSMHDLPLHSRTSIYISYQIVKDVHL